MKISGPIKDSPFKDAVAPKPPMDSDHEGIVTVNSDLKGIPMVMGTDVLEAGEGSDLFQWVRDLG